MDRDGDRPRPQRSALRRLVVLDLGEFPAGHVDHLLGGAGQGRQGTKDRAPGQDGEGQPAGEAEQGDAEHRQRVVQGAPGETVGPGGDLLDQRPGDVEAGLGLPGSGGDRLAQLLRGLALEGARIDLELREPGLDAVLLGLPGDPAEAQDLFRVGDPAETGGLFLVELVGADRTGVLGERVGIPGLGGEHPALVGRVGGVGAQHRVEQTGDRGRRGAGEAVQADAVDQVADGGSVRGIDARGRNRAPFDLVAQHGEAPDELEGPRLVLRQPRPERGTHGGDLLIGVPLGPAVGGGGRQGGAGPGRLLLHGQQERLPVFGLYVVDQPRDLLTVAHQLRAPAGVPGLLHLGVDADGQQHADDGDGRDHQNVELAPERPSVQEGARLLTEPRLRRWTPGRVRFVWRVHCVHRHPGLLTTSPER